MSDSSVIAAHTVVSHSTERESGVTDVYQDGDWPAVSGGVDTRNEETVLEGFQVK